MKIVIDIPEKRYRQLKKMYKVKGADEWQFSILNGIPLPKGHGRLIDAERLLTVIHRNTVGDLFDQLIDMQPTIIEADKEEV